ncbi:hypothetical protein [Neorhizobium galegae]|uniref:Uncharacterized protein n=1 Tax=Neorhizobium galegae bv. orientalis str. HAMBI 540 TaxID=1028800 RepID=A0A068SP77_NEOGA|nr:hypothetical protein [Neorhizobium galegae]MCQ1856202.1 hypothetical protein [Neorhizobium galegae]CDN47576.1 Hypothetical protein RG540_CH13960 [Neorhizobium galegae bv. orientalis str. HAMBI 540]
MSDLAKIMADLHSALANELLERVNSKTATASDLSVVRQFLKDNGIDSVPKKGDPLERLSHTLPFTGPEDDETAGYLPN